MKFIPLTREQFAKVDDEDFGKFGRLKWFAAFDKSTKKFYAARCGRAFEKRFVYLHRSILGITDPALRVDHRNHDTLDCRRENLRCCTNSQNMSNRNGPQANSKSGLRGVFWGKRDKKWVATIRVRGKGYYLGSFTDKNLASSAYWKANRKYFGEFGGDLSAKSPEPER